MLNPLITDAVWKRLEPTFTGSKLKKGKDDRKFLEAICWVMRTSLPWSSLPQELGPWKTAYNRYIRVIKNDHLKQILSDLKQIDKAKNAHRYN